MMSNTHRIEIEPTVIRGERGQRYRVHFEGAVLIDDTWNPEFEACRALVARGVAGRLQVWRPSAASPDLILGLIFPDIEEGARWTVRETRDEGPRIVRWQPFPDLLDLDAVCDHTVLAPEAEILAEVP